MVSTLRNPTRWTALCLLALLPAAPLWAQPEPQAPPEPRYAALPQPRYAALVEGELAALELEPQCHSDSALRHVCRYKARSSATERDLDATAVYSDETDTVHIYIERYLAARADDPRTPQLLQRMMELNWEMLVGKLEWNPSSGEVRLSVVMSTDSNFDRRAFRSLVKTLDTLSARHRASLASIMQGG